MKTSQMIAALALALPLVAMAQQTVWRCGADGRTYSQTPCAEGRALEALEARPAADIAQAQQAAASERQQADRMTRERLAAEAAARGNGLAAMTAVKPAAKPAPRPPAKHQHHPRQNPADDGIWRATAPSSRRAKG